MDETSLKCLDLVELKDGNSKVLESKGTLVKILEKKPFTRGTEICKREKRQDYIVNFHFREGSPLQLHSKATEYEMSNFFLRKQVSPYCLHGTNFTVALMQNMVHPEVYKNCFDKAEICDCYSDDDFYDCN